VRRRRRHGLAVSLGAILIFASARAAGIPAVAVPRRISAGLAPKRLTPALTAALSETAVDKKMHASQTEIGEEHSMNVLVVDDDAVILQLIGRILGASGNRLLLTTDAREAIAAIEAHDIDLLISDVLMPVMTGPELAAVARRLRPRISVLYMSASERPDGFPVLVKPFYVQELLDAMRCALQWPTATAASEPSPG